MNRIPKYLLLQQYEQRHYEYTNSKSHKKTIQVHWFEVDTNGFYFITTAIKLNSDPEPVSDTQ
jgi:hypothetical protein